MRPRKRLFQLFELIGRESGAVAALLSLRHVFHPFRAVLIVRQFSAFFLVPSGPRFGGLVVMVRRAGGAGRIAARACSLGFRA